MTSCGLEVELARRRAINQSNTHVGLLCFGSTSECLHACDVDVAGGGCDPLMAFIVLMFATRCCGSIVIWRQLPQVWSRRLKIITLRLQRGHQLILCSQPHVVTGNVEGSNSGHYTHVKRGHWSQVRNHTRPKWLGAVLRVPMRAFVKQLRDPKHKKQTCVFL